jgi:hypothetical protein
MKAYTEHERKAPRIIYIGITSIGIKLKTGIQVVGA